jgi:hypothetical protein
MLFRMVAAAALALSGAAAAQEAATGGGYVPPKPKQGYSYPECYCTGSNGERVEVGELACLSVGGRQVLSRCEKRRNLVIWNHQAEECPNV